eukprot:gnl/TRDRNA2_/TRDRNA2_151097_c1_seq2.p1 gnl/TRDRNA2_/TRDRNA2_151097_c1~~gnl/TRDRNA2_/TRDRNA2_151097_c1_seq2.p1  ORF type:complete len:865 (-),score=290.92 gnl/TRDRNA2_/TRDRNA2_151097_c1_seq2:108-2702(-)
MAPEGAEAKAKAEADAKATADGKRSAEAVADEEQPQPPDKRQKLGAPPDFNVKAYVAAADGWWAHKGGEWLFNVEERTYFHLPTGQLHLETDAGLISMSGEAEGSAEPEPEGTAAPTHRGKVKWFNDRKGFGFIEPLAGGDDIFVHRNQLGGAEDNLFASISPGTLVTYSLGETDNGRVCAVNVHPAKADAVDTNEKNEENAEGEEDDEEEDEEVRRAMEEAMSEASSVEIDLFEELKSGMFQQQGANKDKTEDYAVVKAKIPIGALSENENAAMCLFFGVFDGHGGSYCAEYAAAQVAKNVLSRLHDRPKNTNDEVALKAALVGGFKQTEHNFLQHAKKADDTSGTTACTITVYGPDEESRLRIFSANVGDSRAVLGCVDGSAVRLTEDHKPNLPAEKKRIQAAGGAVAEVGGCWRAMLPQTRKLGIVGLAVSRALGDYQFKNPDIVSAEPDIRIHEVDWEKDEFVIIASDGVWDVISDKEAVKVAQKCLRKFAAVADNTSEAKKTAEEKAAETLVKLAGKKGSVDDCTAVVVRFGWNKQEADEADGDDGEEEDEAAAEEEAPAAEAEDQAGEEKPLPPPPGSPKAKAAAPVDEGDMFDDDDDEGEEGEEEDEDGVEDGMELGDDEDDEEDDENDEDGEKDEDHQEQSRRHNERRSSRLANARAALSRVEEARRGGNRGSVCLSGAQAAVKEAEEVRHRGKRRSARLAGEQAAISEVLLVTPPKSRGTRHVGKRSAGSASEDQGPATSQQQAEEKSLVEASGTRKLRRLSSTSPAVVAEAKESSVSISSTPPTKAASLSPLAITIAKEVEDMTELIAKASARQKELEAQLIAGRAATSVPAASEGTPGSSGSILGSRVRVVPE